MTSLLMCCKTHQSVIEKSTVVAKDTTTIRQAAAKDSTSFNAKIDSIIIEEYNQDDEEITKCVSQKKQRGCIRKCQKRNDISQNKVNAPTKKIKVYGINLPSNMLANKDSLNKQTKPQEKTVSQVKQKTPKKRAAGGKIVYILIGITLLLFAGYVVWKKCGTVVPQSKFQKRAK